MRMAEAGELSSRGVKDVLAVLLREGGDARAVAQARGLFQVSDEEALKELAREIISEHPSVVEEYKAGKEASLQFLIGQGMKKTKGSANPETLKALLVEMMRGA